MKTIITTGCFNLLTPGHIYFLRRARELGERLVVFLDSDERNQAMKGEKAIFTWRERESILSSLSFVDKVIRFKGSSDISDFVSKNVSDSFLFVKGRDYDISTLDENVKHHLDQNNIPIAFIRLLEGHSTTKLFEKIAEIKKREEMISEVPPLSSYEKDPIFYEEKDLGLDRDLSDDDLLF